jgi:autotransporter-associated beta strand protein
LRNSRQTLRKTVLLKSAKRYIISVSLFCVTNPYRYIYMRNKWLSIAASLTLAASLQAQITWTGDDFLWNQPDIDSFDAEYTSGADVVFGNTGVGAVTVGAGVTPGSVTFNHTSGTYTFTGTAWNAGTNALNLSGGGVVQFGNLTNAPFLPTWGATNISGGSQLSITRGGNIGNNNGLITLDNGTLLVSADNSGAYSYTNAISVASGGGQLVGRSSGNNYTRLNFTGAISGSGPLTLTSTTGSTSNQLRGFGLILSGDNSGFTGDVVINSFVGGTTSLPIHGQFGSAFTTVQNAGALFQNASSITVRDGGIIAVDYAAGADLFDNVTFGPRSGIGATGGSGSLTAFSSPMDYVGVGGMMVLDNTNALNNNRIADTATLAFNNNRLHIIGRSANTNQTNEVVGAITVSGGSLLTIDRPNANDSGVKLTVGALTAPGVGSSLLINASTWGTTAALNNLIVTGSKPTETNGMITPAIQHFTGGNSLGDFLGFTGDNLLAAAYTNYASDWSAAGASDIVNLTAATTLTGSGALDVHALRIASGNQNLGGRTINLGSGGFITNNATTSNGTLNFGSHGVIGAYNGASQATISASIRATNGLTIIGSSQTLNVTGNNTDLNGGIFINNGVARFTTAGANGNDVTIGPFGRLVAGSGATDRVGGVSGAGVISAWVANSATTPSTLEISPASGTHVFEGALLNGSGSPRPLNIIKSGDGTQVFGVNSLGQYTGDTNVTGGTLLIHGDFSAATGTVSVSNNAVFGGTGTIGGDLSLVSGTSLVFNPISPLTVIGGVTLPNDFSVASLLGLNSSIALGIYTVIGGTTSDFSNIQNFGSTNAASIGDGKFAYFQNGSLQLVVIPEPSTYALLFGLAVLGLVVLRRRR